jgi:hypothetical protein
MDDSEQLVFANKVIRQMIRQVASGEFLVDPRDYMAIRVAFRSSGGSWSELGMGNRMHIDLLKNLVKAWGQSSDRRNTTEFMV